MCSNLDNYDRTVTYLYGLQKHGIKLGLANTEKLMRILGEPRKAFRSVHIAGTNGKGSTANAISSILHENGFKVGLFTSPHLVSFTERIRVNGQKISESRVIELASKVRRSIEGTDLNPTFFEFVTAMAFCHFASEDIDWAVIETGMGGRLDATNVLNPDLTIITNISLDHSEFLGNSIPDITYEKAGIIKPQTPVITASQDPDVVRQLSDIAGSRNSEIHVYNRDYSGSIIEMDARHLTIDYSGYNSFKNIPVNISGNYQLYNMCTAIRAVEILRQKGIAISDDAIRNGLRRLNIEGRLEWASTSPPILIDSAHNPEAAGALAASIEELFPDRKIVLITGIMDDKDMKGILHNLVRIAASVILTRPDYGRSASPEKLKDIIKTFKEITVPVYNTDSVSGALNMAKSLLEKDGLILIAGSFYTAGEAKEALGCKPVLPKLRE